jgi:hypothetical protein
VRDEAKVMRVTGHPESRFLGYVQLRVGSRVFTLPVEAAPLPIKDVDGSERKAGFFSEEDRLGILVDSSASDAAQKETIERASVDAARHISQKFLN